jgi:hypothetical protein
MWKTGCGGRRDLGVSVEQGISMYAMSFVLIRMVASEHYCLISQPWKGRRRVGLSRGGARVLESPSKSLLLTAACSDASAGTARFLAGRYTSVATVRSTGCLIISVLRRV